jgi:hypothetical protein
MPRWLQIIVAVFLDLPGALLWIAGGTTTVLTGIAAMSSGTFPDAGTILVFAGAAAVATIGFLMMATHDLLTGGSRIPGEQLPKIIAMELVVQATVGLSPSLSWRRHRRTRWRDVAPPQ